MTVQTKTIQSELNLQISNWSVLYTKLHRFHWYVKGPAFFTLHAKFEELYDEAALVVDEAAERLLAIGGQPVATLKEYLETATIEESVHETKAAEMVATLANGGVNPVTKKKVVSPDAAMHTMSVMATAGLYDDTGIWLYATGLPGKSGVGGGLIAACPGKFGIAVVSPPLDAAGNSVKGQLTIKYIVEKLKANPYLVQPK